MPNIINKNGIQTKPLDEIIDSIVGGTAGVHGLKDIYGSNINIASDTPDGQLVNIFALAVKDVLDLAVQTYNSFDPDLAVGRALDQRCAINGVTRQAGSYTQARVRVTINRPLTLHGLDSPAAIPFTVCDSEGNRYMLKNTVALAGPAPVPTPEPDTDTGTENEPGNDADTENDLETEPDTEIDTDVDTGSGEDTAPVPGNISHDLVFRAEHLGRVICLPNTITTPITIILGVVAIDNPPYPATDGTDIPDSPPGIIIGTDEESDYSLRARRVRSLSLPAIGSTDGILASILAVKDVTEAVVYENISNEEDKDGIPGHSIWCIVKDGAPDEIARAIYMKRNAGCGMKGEEKINMLQEDGTEFEVCFDRPNKQPLWIMFNATRLASDEFGEHAQFLREMLVEKIHYSIFQKSDVTTITQIAREIMPDIVISEAGVSLNGKEWKNIVTPTTKQDSFELSANRIIINGIRIDADAVEDDEASGI